MSDVSQGEGWWQASDGKWYPPELHPDVLAPAAPPAPTPPPGPPSSPEPVPPTQPVSYPTAPPTTIGAPAVPPLTPPPAAPASAPSGRGKWIAVAAVAAAVVLVVAFLALRGGGGSKDNAAAKSDASSDSSSSSSKSTKSSKSGSSGASSSSAAGTGVTLDPATAGSKLLKAADIGSSFVDTQFARNTDPKTNCGQANPDSVVPPTAVVGSEAASQPTSQFFREEVDVYKDAASTAKAFDLNVQGVGCTQGTLADGSAVVFDPVKDVSSEFGTKAIDLTVHIGQQTDGEIIAVRAANGIVVVQQQAPAGQLPGNAIGLTKQALARLQG